MITRKGDTDTLRRLMEMSQLRWRDPRTPMDEQLHPCNATWGALDGLADRDLPATSIILDPRDEFFDIFGPRCFHSEVDFWYLELPRVEGDSFRLAFSPR